MDPIVYSKLRVIKGDVDESSFVSSGYVLQSESLTGFFPNSSHGKTFKKNNFIVITSRLLLDACVSGLSFSACEEPSGIFISFNASNGGKLEYWELAELERAVHPMFSTAPATTRYQSWQCVSSFLWVSNIALICPSKKNWVSSPDISNPLSNPLVIATSDGDLLYLNKATLKQVIFFLFQINLH